ncbi:MAG: GNAT family N-acetyltransferase [Mycobacteriales bacterium]
MAANGIVIRQATADDGDTLSELDFRCWTPIAEVMPRPEKPRRPFFDDRLTPDQVLVAERDATIVGWLALRPSTPVPSNRHVLQIQGLGVVPEARGAGIGMALLETAADVARSRGARKLTLRVLATNTPAQRLYARAGYHTEGTLREEFLIENQYVDDILMARPL